MFDVEVLEDLEGEGAVLLVSGDCLQYLLECVDDVWNDKLIFLSDCVTVFFIFFPENPPINPLCYGYLLLLVEA